MNFMFQKEVRHCSAGHSSNDIVANDKKNYISSSRCELCIKGHFIKDFGTWTSGNAEIDKVIQERQINNYDRSLQWIPYNNFEEY